MVDKQRVPHSLEQIDKLVAVGTPVLTDVLAAVQAATPRDANKITIQQILDAISLLAANATPVGTDDFASDQGGVAKRISLDQIHDPIQQELLVSGAVLAGVRGVELNHISTIIAATIADSTNHLGLLVVKNTSASGTAAHTLTLTAGTFDGTNTIATLNAANEALAVWFDSGGDGTIIENVGAVVLS